jgi:hypothetical protein
VLRRILAFLLGFTLMLGYLGTRSVLGRDLDGRYASSPLKPWFDQLASGKGRCCSDADGAVVNDADWESKDGHYRVFISGDWIKEKFGVTGWADSWYDVPDDAVITEPNLARRTIVWPILGPVGLGIRCFMPGSMT